MTKTRRAVSTTTAILAIIVIVLAIAIIYLYYQQTAYRSTSTTQATQPPVTTAPAGNKLRYDASNKTVYVALETRTSNYDFNGSTRGRLTIYIPAGWSLVIKYTNDDPNYLPHSMGIIANTSATPRNPDPTANGNLVAWIPDSSRGQQGYKEGIGSGETAILTATSIQKGVYWIACGIPGHITAGMWIVLVSSDTVTEPYYVAA